MKTFMKPVIAAGLALAATAPVAMPAQAQVAGIATSTPEAVIVRSAARVAGYQAINSTYASQIQQISTLSQEVQTLSQSLDTDGDQNLTQQEVDANPAVSQQVQQKQQQIETLSQPIVMAQYWVIEQLLRDYGNAQQQVVNNKGIQIMLAREAFQYAPEGVDVTEDILAALDQRLPTVQTVPVVNYNPSQATVQMHQSVQQIILGLAQRAAAQQAQQGAAAQQPAPTGR